MHDVPVIDISAFGSQTDAISNDRSAVAGAIDDACRTVGFFKISGHGVSPELIRDLEAVTTAFFDLPEAAKLGFQSPHPEVNRGYAPLGSEALSYSVGLETPPDLFEAFNVGVQNHTIDPATLARHHAVLYHDNIWPTEPTEMRPIWEKYLVAMTDLGGRILDIMAVALGLDEDYFSSQTHQAPDVFRSLNYVRSPGSADPLPGQMRLGAHSDYGMVTILHADPVPGLQILRLDGSWADVVATPGTFIVNLGDMLAAWTNDRWRSTVHRVVPPPAGDDLVRRRSYAFFHEADTTAVIEPLATCVDTDHPVRYPTMTAGDHLYNKIVAPRSMTKSAAASTTADRGNLLSP